MDFKLKYLYHFVTEQKHSSSCLSNTIHCNITPAGVEVSTENHTHALQSPHPGLTFLAGWPSPSHFCHLGTKGRQYLPREFRLSNGIRNKDGQRKSSTRQERHPDWVADCLPLALVVVTPSPTHQWCRQIKVVPPYSVLLSAVSVTCG